MKLKAEAKHYIDTKPHGLAKWTRARMEPVMADLRAGMKRKEAAVKYGIAKNTLDRKIEEYNTGTLR